MSKMGYVVVRKPEFVGERFGDIPQKLSNTHQKQIRYCGVSRDPWWDLNGLFYDGKLSEGEKALRNKINDFKIPFFCAGLCEHLDDAREALLISDRERRANEIIFISDPQPEDEIKHLPFGLELLGFDYYIDGYGSVIRLGIFTKPEAFRESIEVLNPNGLFDGVNELNHYLELYVGKCKEENLEIIDVDKMRRPPFSVYRVD